MQQSDRRKILIIGGSGFLGNALYKELCSYYDTYATFCTANKIWAKNQHFYAFDFELDPVETLLDQLQPDIIISAVRGNFTSQVRFHLDAIAWLQRNDAQMIFLSSANVFDAFYHYPSYEYDKTYSQSRYGYLKIKIENALLRLPQHKYIIARLPMIFGHRSPEVEKMKLHHRLKVPIEVFPNVVINATTFSKFTQQIHYMINRSLSGIYHLGSADLTHHSDLVAEICEHLQLDNPVFKQVFDTNNDRYLAAVPKENRLPDQLSISIAEVVTDVKLL